MGKIKHYINYLDNIYYIEVDDVIVFSVELDKLNKEIHLRVPSGEFKGKVEDLKILKKDIDNK